MTEEGEPGVLHGDESAPVRVPAKLFDLDGTLLAVAETTARPGTTVAANRGDAADLLLAGRGLPDFGPTRIPTLTWPAAGDSGQDQHDGEAPPASREAPSGSALSSLDVHAFFERIANEYARAGGSDRG